MTNKVKEEYGKQRLYQNKDKSKKYILRGEKNLKYYDKILSKSSTTQPISRQTPFP